MLPLKIILILLTCVEFIEAQTFGLKTSDDCGSGASIRLDWYTPGGLGGSEMFIGNPNALGRNDRALIRFDIQPYLLRPVTEISIDHAVLSFKLTGAVGKEKERQIEISHLKYDALNFSGNDLVNNGVDINPVRHGSCWDVDVDDCRENRYRSIHRK
jgi:hypothetical protein